MICCLFSVVILDDSQKDKDKKVVMDFAFPQPVISMKMRHDRYRTSTDRHRSASAVCAFALTVASHLHFGCHSNDHIKQLL